MATTANTKSNRTELGALWKRESQQTGEKYLSGKINLKNIPGFPDQDIELYIPPNKFKEVGSKQPDLRIFVSERQNTGAGTATAPRAASAPVAAAAKRAPAPVAQQSQELI